MTFERRKIDVTITLGTEKSSETLKLTGHRVLAEVATITTGMQPQAEVKIYGLPLHIINQMTVVGPVNSAIRGKNKILIEAGNYGAAMSNLFYGAISEAWGDFQAAPDASLTVSAMSALDASMKPVPPSSFKGSTAAEMIIAGLAKNMGFSFENHGVSAQLSNPYLPGTAYEQMTSCARAAGINYIVDRGVLAIWPANGFISGNTPIVSPQTGMVGYPTFSSNGIAIVSIFRPEIRAGAQIFVDSSIEPARGYWNVSSVSHSLESERPGGPWVSYINAYRPPHE